MKKDSFFLGLSIFGFLFGVGNLFSPIKIGLIAGPFWFIGLIGFIIIDIFLSILCLWVYIKFDTILQFLKPLGKIFSNFLVILFVVCMVLFTIPRIATVSYLYAIKPILPFIPATIYYFFFFVLVVVLALNPFKVLSIIGKIFTPILLITMLGFLIIGIFLSYPTYGIESATIENMFTDGLKQAFGTNDALASITVGGLMMVGLRAKGYKKEEERAGILFITSIITALLMIFIYCAMAYLSSVYMGNVKGVSDIQLLVNIFNFYLGSAGKYFIALISFLAALNITIGDIAIGSYLFGNLNSENHSRITPSKSIPPYYYIILIIMALSAFILTAFTLKLDLIQKYSLFFLNLAYPIIVVLVLFSLFGLRNKSFTFIIVLTIIITCGIPIAAEIFPTRALLYFKDFLPLANLGFGWVIPTLIIFFIGLLTRALFKKKSVA
jgi:LIVCS family branched-chain amino acid:cation transporter